eukprot:1306088-Rhodomonas_salina.1
MGAGGVGPVACDDGGDAVSAPASSLVSTSDSARHSSLPPLLLRGAYAVNEKEAQNTPPMNTMHSNPSQFGEGSGRVWRSQVLE